MVYDGTGSGLNKSLWTPSYGHPTIEMLLRGVVLESYFGDNELVEVFWGFTLYVSLCPYYGVDLTNFYSSNLLAY